MAATAHSVLPDTAALPHHTGRASRILRVLLSGLDHWHLVSLDAPTVAVLWTWFIAKANHLLLPLQAIAAMGLAVWLLYASDRLLDSRGLPSSGTAETNYSELEARHLFHRRHRRGFGIGISAALAALAFLLPQLPPQSIRLYLVLGTLLFGYFVLIHVHSAPPAQDLAQRLPKELAVGVFFSAATFIPTVARAPELRSTLLAGAILFAVLCSLNCLFIYAWEHPFPSPQAHAATRIALRWLPYLAILAILAGLLLALADRSLPWPIPTACVLATCLLLILHRGRHRISPTTLRAAADLCLLTPALLIPLFCY